MDLNLGLLAVSPSQSAYTLTKPTKQQTPFTATSYLSTLYLSIYASKLNSLHN